MSRVFSFGCVLFSCALQPHCFNSVLSLFSPCSIRTEADMAAKLINLTAERINRLIYLSFVD